MRLVTWNVLGLTGYPPEVAVADIGAPGEPANVEHFTAVLDGLEADVIALQEGVAHRLAQDLARRLERHLATLPSPLSWPGHVLSRAPIVESRTYSHAPADGSLGPFSRVCGAVRLQLADAGHMWVLCIHLHPGDVELRAREADLLRRHVEDLVSVCDRVAVLGDYNCDTSERVHAHLRALGFLNAMATAGGGLQLTMDTAGIRPWRIDHIYVSPALAPHLRDAAVVRGAGFRTDPPRGAGVWDHSDHLPVMADLDWPA